MRKLLLIIIIFLPLGFMASKYSPFIPVPEDEKIIIFNDIPYDGKRIYIGPITTNSTRSEIRFNICNTGRQDIQLGGDYSDILIKLDPSFHQIGSEAEVREIVRKIMSKNGIIKAGKMITNQRLALGNAPVMANRSEASMRNKTTSTTSSSASTKSNTASNTTSKTNTSASSSAKKKSDKSSRPEPKEIEMGNGTVVLEMPESEKNTKRGKFLNPDDCPDLMIKDIKVIKENKFHIAIEYTVKNQGTGTAELHGQKDRKGKNQSNMIMKAYLSATPKFTRSATAIGEVEVRKEMDNKDGTLPRSREFTGKMYMNVRGRTNMTPYLILTLDPYQTVRECNERNNRSYVKIQTPSKR